MRQTVRLTLSTFLIAGFTFAVAGPAYAAPANELIAGATVVPSLPYVDVQDTTETAATPEAPSSSCAISHTVWYEFTATTDGFVRADTFGSNFDTMIVAYAVTGTELTEVGCDDDEGPDATSSQLTFAVTAGTTYLIQVGGAPTDSTGSLTFHLQESGPPFGIGDIAITRATLSQRGSVVTITGTITCLGTPEDVVITLTVVERIGQRTVTGEGSATLRDCRGETEFTAQVTASSGRFVPGRARIDASATSQTDSFETSTTVRLRPR
jgi:hypothetical protein